MQDLHFISHVIKAIDQSQVISFDIFDTLLLRPYCSPKDLFLHIEEQYQYEGFRDERVNAEKRCRLLNKDIQDIDYDKIYKEISPQYTSLKAVELTLEKQVLCANPELKIIWEYAKKTKKKIVICTDMYLKREFLTELLQLNGFSNYECLYISGELGKTKKTGDLFHHILKDLNVKPHDIVHIGDNIKGDYKVPLKLGINAILYPQVIQQYLKANTKAKAFSTAHSSLGHSILLAVQALEWHKQRFEKNDFHYWEFMGYSYAGPLAYGFARWISDQAKRDQINHILMVARDGYLSEKALKTINCTIKSSYVYAPRFFNLIYRLDYDVKRPEQAKAIVEYYAQQSPKIKALICTGYQNFHHLIQKNYAQFKILSERNLEKYKQYLNGIIHGDDKLAMVDTKTIAFSSQKLLETVLGKRIYGYYWSTLLRQKTQNYMYSEFIENYYQQYSHLIFSKNWKLIELLLSAPEYPVVDLDCQNQPIFKENLTDTDQILFKNYQAIEQGAICFFDDLKTHFGDFEVRFEPRDLIAWANAFCEYPTQDDYEHMKKIQITPDVTHQDFQSLFLVNTKTSDWIKHPFKTAKSVKSAQWKTKRQLVLLNIIKPFKIKFKKRELLRISFFPYLQVQILFFSLKISKKFRLLIEIGKHHA